MGTGPLSEGEAEKAGLVPRHAYAVLQVVHALGKDMLQLKNPWSERRWKVGVACIHGYILLLLSRLQGNYSEYDRVNWTHELKQALNYDQMQALQVDNGIRNHTPLLPW